MGKHPPLDAAADEIEDGVEDFAPVDGLRPPSRFGLGNQGPDQLPLGIGQIGGVFLRVSYPFLRPKRLWIGVQRLSIGVREAGPPIPR